MQFQELHPKDQPSGGKKEDWSQFHQEEFTEVLAFIKTHILFQM